MKIKQARCFKLHESIQKKFTHFEEEMQDFLFAPCIPSLPTSMGWVPPIEEEEGLLQKIDQYLIACLQVEEKILPASVIRQHVAEAVKQTEQSENRKLGRKERDRLKDEITYTLMPRAFSKFTKTHIYFDLKRNWLVVNTTSAKHIERILIALKKTFGLDVQPIAIPELGKRLTHWLRHHSVPDYFSIENACLLQDPRNIARVIRCKTQNLFSKSILDLVHDGCEVKQILLSWRNKIDFMLSDDASLSSFSLKQDDLTLTEDVSDSPKMKFIANFMLYASFVTPLMSDLLEVCEVKTKEREEVVEVA